MRKFNRKGFTLIELLAVIVIMGILMMVAIPAVQRYINNSKKDTLINVAKTYVDATRNAYAGKLFTCTSVCSVKFKELRDKGLVEDTKGIQGAVTITVDTNGNATYYVAAGDPASKYAISTTLSPSAISRGNIVVSTASITEDTYGGTVTIEAE